MPKSKADTYLNKAVIPCPPCFFCQRFIKEGVIISLPLVIVFLFLFPTCSFGADIKLSLTHRSINDNVIVGIENRSSVSVKVETVSVELDKKKYKQTFNKTIPPHGKREFFYKIEYPSLPGTYPLTATLRYYNDGTTLSLKHVAMFNYLEPAGLDTTCFPEKATIHDKGDIIVKSSRPDILRLILPDEVKIISVSTFPGKRIFHVKTSVAGFRNRYTFFAVAEEVVDGKHHSIMRQTVLETGFKNTVSSKRGNLPSSILLAQALIFLFSSWYLLKTCRSETGFSATLTKYTSRMFYITFFYFCLKNIHTWLDFSLSLISWDPANYLLGVMRDNFTGPNYNYFFQYFIDYYWGACLLLSFPYLYYCDSDKPLCRDKYSCFLKTLLSVFNLFRGKKIYWNYYSRLGMLTIGVKVFYIPYLVSWVINNTFHQSNLAASFRWDLQTVNSFLVALFIYTDTIIYSFGYLVESKFLKNRIKSVEPTFFGWVVCLWCYPPFNVFSFRLFDYPVINIAREYPLWATTAMTCAVSLLWGVFTWASVALGFKASNLTNRGIVSSGPYCFVRHPAYSAKLLLWLIQGVFFARFGVGILLGFILIYFLRAWTEERHLSLDPEYIKYKKKVPWKFIPGVF